MQLTDGQAFMSYSDVGHPSDLVGDYLPNKKRQQFNLLAFALLGQVDLFSTLLGVLRTSRVFHVHFPSASDGLISTKQTHARALGTRFTLPV